MTPKILLRPLLWLDALMCFVACCIVEHFSKDLAMWFLREANRSLDIMERMK